MKVTVYSKPNCQGCDATYRKLTQFGVEYDVIDTSTDDDAKAYVRSLGFRSAPVVVAEGVEPWNGYKPDHIKKIAEIIADEQHSSDTEAAEV